MNIYSILFDVATVAIIALTVYEGYKRGLLKTVISIAGLILACLAAFIISNPVGDAINSSCMNKIVTGTLTKTVKSGSGDFLSKIIGSIPNTVGTSLSGISKNLGDASEKAVSEAISAVCAPVSSIVSRCIAFIIILIICIIAIRVIAHFSDVLKHIPIVGTLNAVGGAVVGVIKAFLIMFLISTVVSVSVSVMALGKNPVITQKTIESTYIYKYIDNMNPLTRMLLNK